MFHISAINKAPINKIAYFLFNFSLINANKTPKDNRMNKKDLHESDCNKEDLSAINPSRKPSGVLTPEDIGVKSFSDKKSKNIVGKSAKISVIPPAV